MNLASGDVISIPAGCLKITRFINNITFNVRIGSAAESDSKITKKVFRSDKSSGLNFQIGSNPDDKALDMITSNKRTSLAVVLRRVSTESFKLLI
jgi:hypothetical protein